MSAWPFQKRLVDWAYLAARFGAGSIFWQKRAGTAFSRSWHDHGNFDRESGNEEDLQRTTGSEWIWRWRKHMRIKRPRRFIGHVDGMLWWGGTISPDKVDDEINSSSNRCPQEEHAKETVLLRILELFLFFPANSKWQTALLLFWKTCYMFELQVGFNLSRGLFHLWSNRKHFRQVTVFAPAASSCCLFTSLFTVLSKRRPIC